MLINRSKVKQFALEMAKSRAHKFTRVSGEFLAKCEGQLKGIHHEFGASAALQR